MDTYCFIFQRIVRSLMFFSILASLFHLVLISLERFIALKYTLQYFEIVTKRRLLEAVALCWCPGIVTLFTNLSFTLFPFLVISVSIVFSLLIIAYSHLSDYQSLDVTKGKLELNRFLQWTQQSSLKKTIPGKRPALLLVFFLAIYSRTAHCFSFGKRISSYSHVATCFY